MSQDGPGSEAVVDVLAELGALPQGAVAAGRRLREMTSQAGFERALRQLESDERLKELFREAVRNEIDQLPDAETLDQVLELALRILLEVQKLAAHPPADQATATSHPWLLLEGPGNVRAAATRVAMQFDMREATSFTGYVDLAMSIRNVGARAAEHVVVEFSVPSAASDVSAWHGQARHYLDTTAPPELFDPQRPVYMDRPSGAGDPVLRQRLRIVPQSSAEPLIQLCLTVRAKNPGWTPRTLRYHIHAADGPHTAGEIAVEIEFTRGPAMPLRWEPRTSWFCNKHPDGDDLRIRRRGVSLQVPADDVVELGAPELDEPANRNIVEWRDRGWLRQVTAPPWARDAPRTYVYRHPKAPRLLVHRLGARPRLLRNGRELVDLARADFEMPENGLLRRYALDKLVIPAEEDHTGDVPDMFAAMVDLGLQPTVPVGDDLRPLSGAEVRRQLVAEGRRPRDFTKALLEEELPNFVEILGTIKDQNGVAAGTIEEAQAWLGFRLAPDEVRRVLAEIIERGLATDLELGVEDMFAVRPRT